MVNQPTNGGQIQRDGPKFDRDRQRERFGYQSWQPNLSRFIWVATPEEGDAIGLLIAGRGLRRRYQGDTEALRTGP